MSEWVCSRRAAGREVDFNAPADPSLIDSRYAAWCLLATIALVKLGNGLMYCLAVSLPMGQKDFGISRAEVSPPYSLTMIGFAISCILCERRVTPPCH